MCSTTKETLRHYNKIGLLKPAHIAENGYHLYSPAQAVNYLIISTLQSGGFTLDEIKQYFAIDDIREIDTLFRDKYCKQLHQLRELERNAHLLELFIDGIDDARSYFNQHNQQSRLMHLDESFYIQTPLVKGSDETLDLMRCITLHTRLCRDSGIGLGSKLTSSYRLSCSGAEKNVSDLCIITYYNKGNYRVSDSASIGKQPAGQYIETLYPLSDFNTEHDAFVKLNEFPRLLSKDAEQLGGTISDEIFISEIGRYSTENDAGVLVKLQALMTSSH